MTTEIGGFGLRIWLVAVPTFPAGILISKFVDDADPLEHAQLQISERAMGLNGDMVTWKRAIPIDISLVVQPGTDDDKNLTLLASLNRADAVRPVLTDIITMTIQYPGPRNNRTLLNGRLIEASLFPSVASGGRKKSRTFKFSFETIAP